MAGEQATTLLARAAAHVPLDDPGRVAHLLNILRRAGADEQAAELPGIGPRTVVWLNEAQLYLAPDFGLYIRYAPLTFRWRQSADALPTLHTRDMARPVRITRFDGAVLADTLFLAGQAWVKREAGDVDGAAGDLAAAMKLVPADTVEAILGFITDGTLPEPAPGDGGMDAWLETCRQAGAGELEVIRILFPSAAELAQEEREAFFARSDEIRAEAERRRRPARRARGVRTCPSGRRRGRSTRWKGLDRPGVAVRVAAQDGPDVVRRIVSGRRYGAGSGSACPPASEPTGTHAARRRRGQGSERLACPIGITCPWLLTSWRECVGPRRKDITMTQHKDRKQAIRARMAFPVKSTC